MIKYTIVVLLLLLSSNSRAEDLCAHKARIASKTDIRICSYEKIENSDILFIKDTIEASFDKYISFLKMRNIKANKIKDISRFNISVLSHEAMNDGTLPAGLSKENNVVGRYYADSEIIFIESSTIKSKQPILFHEIAHRFNDKLGITDADEDEALAYEFEAYLAVQ